MGIAIEAIGWVTEIGSAFGKRMHYSLLSYMAFVIIAAISVLALAPYMGIASVAYGVLAGQIAKATFASVLAQRAFPIRWQYRGVVILFLISTVIGILGGRIRSLYGASGLAISSILGCGVIIGVGWSYVFSPDERRFITAAIKHHCSIQKLHEYPK